MESLRPTLDPFLHQAMAAPLLLPATSDVLALDNELKPTFTSRDPKTAAPAASTPTFSISDRTTELPPAFSWRKLSSDKSALPSKRSTEDDWSDLKPSDSGVYPLLPAAASSFANLDFLARSSYLVDPPLSLRQSIDDPILPPPPPGSLLAVPSTLDAFS